jgi:hypothetical protein
MKKEKCFCDQHEKMYVGMLFASKNVAWLTRILEKCQDKKPGQMNMDP